MRGLYLITNDDDFSLLIQKLTLSLATGKVKLLQYRRKHVALEQQFFEIEQILLLCNQYQVPFIINDNINLAKQFNVGVHLGQDDGSISQARQILGKQAIIGRTCLNRLDLAQQAVYDGATYIAFGAIYTSSSKQTQVKNMSLDIIQQAKMNNPNVPICAIGGLTVENSPRVIDAGADMCAVISDILALKMDEIVPRLEAWSALF